MAIDLIGVHTGRMQTDIQNLRQQLKDARNHIEDLKDSMDALNNMWSGEANAAMRQRFQKDYNNLTSLCNFLEELIQSLEAAKQDYDTCERQVQNTVDSLSVACT